MNDIFPEDVKTASDLIESDWISAKEFDGEGLVLQMDKPLEKVVAQNPKYGAKADNFLVKNNILAVGETFRYYFKSTKGNERKIDTNSSPFFIAFKQAQAEEDFSVGDWGKITRTGETSETRYEVIKIEAPDVGTTQHEADEVRPEDIGF
jgi:hypothetical protein